MKYRNFPFGHLVLFLIISGFIAGCSDSSGPEVQSWQLVWQDEFDGPAGQSPDSTRWTYDIGTDWGQ